MGMRRIVLVALGGMIACSSSSGGGGGTSSANSPQASIGPITVAAGQEITECIVIPLGNTEDFVIQGVDVSLAPGSHHLIMYQTGDPPQTTPFSCTPFSEIAFGTGDTPIVFAAKEQESFTFPTGTGLEVPANTNVRLEAHYINATSKTIEGHGQVTVHGVPKSQAGTYQPVGFAFWGTINIDIPANSTASTGPLFQAGTAGRHLMSISTHQHRLGSGIQVWESTASGQKSKQIANDTDWANPSWTMLQPDFAFDGTNGLTFDCSWDNTTTQEVKFGESALDEMCFIGGYEYPFTGLDFCVDGHCKDR